jgi:hypothetical protein
MGAPMISGSNVVALARPLPKYGDALVPAGEYDAALAGVETWQRCHGWAPRVVMVFTIAVGKHYGVAVPGYYGVSRLEGRPRRNGGFVLGTRARLYRDLARMLGHLPPKICVPVDDLHGLYTIVVRDAETDQDGRPLGAAAYSVVDWVKGRA